MKINWKVRLKNKVWLCSFFAAILTFIYTIFGQLDIIPSISRNEAGEIINSALMLLSLFGVIIDPTTAGLNDSNRAMTYEEPHVDVIDDFDNKGEEVLQPEESKEESNSEETEEDEIAHADETEVD